MNHLESPKQWGGKRENSGRHPIDRDGEVLRINISITKSNREFLKQRYKTISDGIRRVIDMDMMAYQHGISLRAIVDSILKGEISPPEISTTALDIVSDRVDKIKKEIDDLLIFANQNGIYSITKQKIGESL
jgi:hypothetical protein